MLLAEILETAFATRKTVWSKRGETITRRAVDTQPEGAVSALTRIEVTDDAKKD